MLVEHDGIEKVAKALTPLRSVNKTLSVVFSRGQATTRDHCLEAVDSYLKDLTQHVWDDFLLVP